ncbi:replicative DNA helicase [Clostridium fermenticellae]|uniref:Replicative DNA helicase n=1 Tax=Clostridium fermenticellae TaxID=2068654 RepID=A0A386H1S3_9CLOT|nr:replicative DNA helicase [Clostridium fermenticellae]AYD39601.1 replicative DNA helicase [Clostridium fermenticellae]AYD39616.1 replicative DNA helicase [Clostridium fermenticellae]
MKLYNIQAERDLLGSIIIKPDNLCDCVDLLKGDDFFKDGHKLIYSAITRLYTSNKDVNVTTIAEALNSKLNIVGGITYISQLAGQTLQVESIKSYAEIIKKYSNARKLFAVLKKDTTRIEKTDADIKSIVRELQDLSLEFESKINADNGELDKPMANVLDSLEKRYLNGGAIQGIGTGYKKLDKTLNGLNRSDFIVISARPSMGKTAFAINMALNISKQHNISFFSLEMSKEQLLERALAAKALIKMNNIKSGKLTDEEWTSISQKSGLIVSSGLKIYDKVYSLNGIKAECKKRKLQEGLDVVIIDYLTLIDGAEKSNNRVQEVSKISRQLKLMAKELNIVVISLAQLSRAPEARNDHRPMLSDLRESGSIEQDADIVISLYRDEYYNLNTNDKGIIEAIIEKQRNGRTGFVKLAWKPEYQLITDKSPYVEDGTYSPDIFKNKGVQTSMN